MEAPKLQTRLKVVLLSLPPRTQAVLDFFFSSTGRGSFVPSAEDSADIAIFDFDTLESRQHWEAFHGRRGCPGIVLSMQPQTIASTVWVSKPVTPAALMAAAAEFRSGRGPLGAAGLSAVDAAALTAPEPTPAPQADPAPAENPNGWQEVPQTAASELATVLSPPPPPPPAPPPPAPVQAPSPRVAPAPPPESPGGFGGLLRKLFGRAKPAPAPTPAVPVPVRPAPVPVPVPPPVAAPEPPAPAPVVATPAPPAPTPAPAPAPAPRPAPPPPAPRPTPAPAAVKAAPAPAVSSRSAAKPAPVTRSVTKPPVPAAPVAAPRAPEPASTPAAPVFDAQGHRRCRPEELVDEARYCGTRGDLDAAQLAEPALRYDPAIHLVGVLKDAYLVSCKWQVPTHLDTSAGRVTVDGTTNLIYCEFEAERLAAMVLQPLDKRPKTRAFSRQEFADLQGTLSQKALVQRLDHVLWQTALETSAGRLPAGVDPAVPVYLKHWPNLTRLHRTPHALRIAALWTTKGASLLETAQSLKIAQRHVFAFYNAALALDLITEDGGQVQRAQRKAKGNRGLLTRLFGWLNK